ncbi:hypothetical protein A2886_02190 [candidate division WWE3 bacterium RIFCSPHIGHO2_01_FULL_42_13]|uniref:Glycosyltransferase RgtA/B/C/D-like domain-containing protein n=1 Tax=candidate division WWE3 bacterium RIFCSPHIGHO2_01_FULL_42_13 TaxID=1802617 RepID=A0A1F4URI9_UNCKA|nr:MAG: hypothetical protein A2886_02190 [candidate division WWE3 bacterium RIFCSPHIGHO2_01_FULL_42_13]
MKRRLVNLFINPLFLTAAVYLVTVFLVSPWGNFAVNDDWDFYTHVRNFMEGDFTKNSLIDSSFVLQGLMGAGWAKIFGLNFTSLKVLTISFTLLMLLGIYKILLQQKVLRAYQFLILFAIAFNPFVYMSSLTFMTENYFLAFLIWSIYFYLCYLEDGKSRSLFLAVLIGGLSILIRQFGFVVFAAYVLTYLALLFSKRGAFRFRQLLLILTPFIIFSLINFLWPQYRGSNETQVQRLNQLFVDAKDLSSVGLRALWALPYIGLSLLPLLVNYLSSRQKEIRFVVLAGAAVLAYQIFRLDIFPMGNVLYVEGLLSKTDFIRSTHLFDNVLFKILLSFIISTSIFTFLLFGFNKAAELAGALKSKRFLIDARYLFLTLLVLGMYCAVALMKGSFDRYYINTIVLLILLSGISFSASKIKVSKIAAVLACLLLFLITFLLNFDYFRTNKLKWSHAERLKEERVLKYSIFLSGTYDKFNSVFYKRNSDKIERAQPKGLTYECYVQTDYESPPNPLLNYLKRFEKKQIVSKYFKNPGIYENLTSPEYRPVSRDLAKIVYKEEYLSPIYNLVGKKVYVVTYCNPRHVS